MIRAGATRRAHAAAILVALFLAVGCPSPEEEAAPPESPVGEVSRIQAGYVGSEACAPCHEDETRSWESSRHRGVFRRGADPAYAATGSPDFESEKIHVRFTVTEGSSSERSRPAMDVVRGGAEGIFAVDAVIGGGRIRGHVHPVLPVHQQPPRFGVGAVECGVGREILASTAVWVAAARLRLAELESLQVAGFHPDTRFGIQSLWGFSDQHGFY